MRIQRKIRHGVQIASVVAGSSDDSLGAAGRVAAADAFGELLQETLTERFDLSKPLILDLSAVSFLNSTSLSILDQCAKTARERGGQLALAGVTRELLGVIRIVKLDRTVPIFPSWREALQFLAPESQADISALTEAPEFPRSSSKPSGESWDRLAMPPINLGNHFEAPSLGDAPKNKARTASEEIPASRDANAEALGRWLEALRLFGQLRELARQANVSMDNNTTLGDFFFSLATALTSPPVVEQSVPDLPAKEVERTRAQTASPPEPEKDAPEEPVSAAPAHPASQEEDEKSLSEELRKIRIRLNELKTGNMTLKNKLDTINADVVSVKKDMRVVKISAQR
jgi:anti-anti-sigma factor